MADARRGLEAVKGHLEQEVVDGRALWFPPSMPGKDGGPTAHLLSIYDEYISGYEDRRDIRDDETGARLAAVGNDLSYLVLIDGQIVGTWKRTLRKDAVNAKARLFRSLTEGEDRALALASQRYAAFYRLPVHVDFVTSS